MKKTSKRFNAVLEKVDAEKEYEPSEALNIVKDCANTKFDETVELAINLGVDPQQSDQNVRVLVVLPNGTGKTVKVAFFAREGRLSSYDFWALHPYSS